MTKLEHEIEQLLAIFNSMENLQDSVESSNMFLETKIGDAETVIVQGNVDGLLYLAECAIKLANSKINGKHFHFDESSSLDSCDKAVTLNFQFAPWESEAKE